jgi:hypothetical protein
MSWFQDRTTIPRKPCGMLKMDDENAAMRNHPLSRVNCSVIMSWQFGCLVNFIFLHGLATDMIHATQCCILLSGDAFISCSDL